jgi:hypothetical protein
LANDAGVTMITGITSASCNTTFTPTVTLHNFGTSTLTSCTINYKIDNQTVQTMPWTGSLAPNTNTTVTLPQQTTTPGGHTFTAYPTLPNAGTDYNGINDQTITQFLVITTNTTAYPMAQPFTVSTFPPTDWALSNPDAGPTWSRISNVGAYGQTPLGTARMDFFNSTEGNIDDLFGAPVNMSSTTGNSYLTFDVAYAPYSAAYADTLKVFVSTDCGATWTQVYNKNATTLATAPATTSSYVPTSSQWRHEVVAMNTYNGQSSVIVKFSGRSGYGNMLYVDNINISSSSSIDDLSAGVSLSVYPNPMNDNAMVTINLVQSETITLDLVNRSDHQRW